jgi:uncharacterized small protein (DUF1192 family)
VLLVGHDGGIESVYRNGPGGAPVDVDRAVVGQVMKERTGLLSTDASTIPSASDAPAGSRRAVLCAPLEAGDRPVGVLYLASQAGAFENEDLQLLTAVSRVSATAVANVRRLAMLETETERLKADLQLKTNLVGDSEPMRRVYDMIGRVARADSNVLIAGETGTGKELVARLASGAMRSWRTSAPAGWAKCIVRETPISRRTWPSRSSPRRLRRMRRPFRGSTGSVEWVRCSSIRTSAVG